MVGTCTVTSTSSEKNYFLKDHLGSIKVIVNASGNVESYTDYDPFGLQLENRYTVNNEERYKFTGKERDEKTSYDYFGARYYDSRIARWLQVDPLAEKYAGWSTYNYTMNNPLKYVDPKGESIWERIKNFVTKLEWRDDNLEENWKQKDYENATPQLAKECGVSKDVKIEYDDKQSEASHVGGLTASGGKFIRMTRSGYEKLDEGNLENAKSSMDHEKIHTESSVSEYKEAVKNVKVKAKWEQETHEKQKTLPSYKSTTSKYKQNVEQGIKYYKKLQGQ